MHDFRAVFTRPIVAPPTHFFEKRVQADIKLCWLITMDCVAAQCSSYYRISLRNLINMSNFSTSYRLTVRAIGALALLAGMHGAAAQSTDAAGADDTIATDRPDFVESSVVVGKGRAQIETSVAYERSRHDGVRERATSTPTLLRFGVADTFELRVETDGWLHNWTRSDAGRAFDSDARGMADTSLGVKWHARDGDEKTGQASLGVLLHVDLPSGAKSVGANGPRPSLRGVAEWELPHDLSLGVMPGIASERNDAGQRFTNGIFAVVLGKQWSPAWRSFVELSAPRIAHGRDGGTQASFDVGGAWMLNRRCQIDAALFRGLNRNTADLAVTVGLSFKL
jgi:hypothetical protein